MQTAGALLKDATRRLGAAGIGSSTLDAELLLAEALGLERSTLLAREDTQVEQAQCDKFEGWIARRLERVPVAYILGRREFWSMEFQVNDSVLVPRPETELLVETVLAEVRGRKDMATSPLIVDVGTGAGPIVLALASELPDAKFHATEISAEALEVARGNASRHGLEKRVQFHQGDLLAPISEAGLDGRIDLVASNPPYVAENDYVDVDVRRWEPSVAVFAGSKGTEIIQRLIAQAEKTLTPGGSLIMELAPSRVYALDDMMAGRTAWAEHRFIPDLAGHSRVMKARLTE
jgi:release factor glutamine methyltransferase